MLTISVAFFTTAILNTPKGEIHRKTDFSANFVKFRGFGAGLGAGDYECDGSNNSIPVSRLITVSHAALKVSGVATMVSDRFLVRVTPV